MDPVMLSHVARARQQELLERPMKDWYSQPRWKLFLLRLWSAAARARHKVMQAATSTTAEQPLPAIKPTEVDC